MATNPELIEHLYESFNRRDIDHALSLMSETVRWPKASEGGSIIGKEEIRAYWTRQWLDFDPIVAPLETTAAEGKLSVRVHQVVRSKAGDLLSDTEVLHVYTVVDDQVQQMELGDRNEAIAAFRSHGA
jgi:hypothetical protein